LAYADFVAYLMLSWYQAAASAEANCISGTPL